ncbi:MAG: hypothetical protein FWH22_08050, partial [Fibromonadales bacterium]|nr:hypothetical protein [Fibromonadales bacterium]
EFFTEEEREQMFASWPSGDIFCKIGEACVEVSAAMCLEAKGTEMPSCRVSSSSNYVQNSSSSNEVSSPSSSSNAMSSSSETSSSSSVAPSSSSVLSSSSSTPSSSSVVLSSSSADGDPCAGFIEGTLRIDHYGKDKPQFCDERDGKKYVYVTIGGKAWMAENLNYEASGSVCYNSNQNYCSTYGRMYNWSTAMNGSASSNAVPSGVQGVCPPGWHLPSEEEWDAMIAAAVGTGTRGGGTILKANSTLWSTNTGEDDHGFSALPGGGGASGSDGGFYNVGYYGRWWSATQFNASYAYRRSMDHDVSYVSRSNVVKSSLYPVRCIRDEAAE